MPQAASIDVPLRLPLVAPLSNRDTTTLKDAKLLNCFAEKSQEGDHWIYKRPGILVNVTKSGNGYGLYNWKGDQYAAFGTSLYKNGTSIGTIDATNGLYKFEQTLGATPRLALGNGVKAYTYDGTTFAQITDGDFPSAFVKGWAYLDGTLYVMKSDGTILGSDINNPTAWDPLNKIIAQIEADGGVALAKQLVYVIAFKQWTTEVFYDAANATGSPLSPVQGAKASYGCASADSVQEIDGTLLWVTTNRSASPQVARMDALAVNIISTPAIDKLLDLVDFTTVYAWQLKHGGHRFYLLTIKNANRTLVYDLDENLWYLWTDKSGNYWPLVSSTYDASLNHYVQHETNGKIYLLDGDYIYPNDDGDLIPVDIYTPNFDGGIDRKKYLHNMRINADQTPGSVLMVRKSDDDYKTWSNFRKIDLSKKRPILDIGDSFYRRAHHFRHLANTALRLKTIDLQMDIGTL